MPLLDSLIIFNMDLDFDVCYESIDILYWDTYSSKYLGPMREKCLSK